MSNSYIKVQTKFGNTVSIPFDQWLTMSDSDWEELMSSDYGQYMHDVYSDTKKYRTGKDYSDEIDLSFEED